MYFSIAKHNFIYVSNPIVLIWVIFIPSNTQIIIYIPFKAAIDYRGFLSTVNLNNDIVQYSIGSLGTSRKTDDFSHQPL